MVSIRGRHIIAGQTKKGIIEAKYILEATNNDTISKEVLMYEIRYRITPASCGHGTYQGAEIPENTDFLGFLLKSPDLGNIKGRFSIGWDIPNPGMYFLQWWEKRMFSRNYFSERCDNWRGSPFLDSKKVIIKSFKGVIFLFSE